MEPRAAVAVFDDQETLRLHSIMGDEESTGTYAQMVEEVEKVSELLQETRESLRMTQDRLTESEKKSEMLEMRLQAEEQELELMNRENEMLSKEEKRLRKEVNRLQTTVQNQPASERPMNPVAENRLKQAVEFLNKDLMETKEKLETTKIELITQRSTSDQLERINAQLRNRNSRLGSTSSGGGTLMQQHELKEAQLQASDLLEENATLRKLLKLEKEKAEEQRKEHENSKLDENAKERIRLEEREATTKAVTRKLRKEISSEINAKKDKEITILREQLKRAFKDKAILEDKIRSQEAAVKETDKLRQEASRAEYEVSRLHEVIDRTREESEAAINGLESKFRMQVHAMQEQQAREKWAKISEMRQQVYQEREHELIDYQHRMQSLTEETSRLLEQAEIEKEQYGREIHESMEMAKQAEVDAMNRELTHFRREAEALRESAAYDKEMILKEFHEKLEKERRSKVIERDSQMQALVAEVKSLQNQCDSLHTEGDEMVNEIRLLKDEKKTSVEQLKQCEMNLKSSKGEIINLKRRNETLRNSIQEYEKVVDSRDEELRKANNLIQSSRMTGSAKMKDREIKLLNGRVEALNLAINKHKHERSRLIDQLGKTKRWAGGLGADSKDYYYFLWTAELAKLERVLKRCDIPTVEPQSSFDQPDDEANMDHETKLRDQLAKCALEETDSLSPPPDTITTDETSESMKGELQTARDAVFRLKSEVKKLGSALAVANGTPPSSPHLETKDMSDVDDHNVKQNPTVLQVDMNVEEVISELEDFFAGLETAEDTNSEHAELLEGLLGTAARESLKICKRIHESDQRCRFLLYQIGEDDKVSAKHAADSESSRKENVRISREFQGTLKQLRETLQSWKMHNSGTKNQIDLVKSKLGMHRKREDSKPKGGYRGDQIKSDGASSSLEISRSAMDNEGARGKVLEAMDSEVPVDEKNYDKEAAADAEPVQRNTANIESDRMDMSEYSGDSMEQQVEDNPPEAWDVRDDASCSSGQTETETSVSAIPMTTQALLHLPNRSTIARRFWQEASIDKPLQDATDQQKKATIVVTTASSTDDASDDQVLDIILADTKDNEPRDQAVIVSTVYSMDTLDSSDQPFDC
mmetsp:Transcript_45236/g.109478  ORF Transcript_45236/g.109478 Transcript_45236/m.109478 type:complete len:1106 (+) Transcript_45236:180-3497(+)|eukprot:CAMPEP_0113652132 /NCGR_PEP_ID=MMETSP0017_2-20120614/27823_1 /TAXON_ID=2856 /ORGANISM="Cylindrotheca closterium" /LENGTH=1105 /DNA_ID=CAMNT_0000564919 /DNA_START=137 /DNA_END=3454 /DNA_ORIENTATION=+ /assembly_acc=CAM_ASM_000147